jgi:hypothetical protein
MKYIIEIPKHCSENWNEMFPTEKGMFCLNCQKEVVDFKNFSNSELAKYISKNEVTCGRFLTTQINQEIILPQNRNHFRFGLFLGISSLFLNSSLYSQETKPKTENIENKNNSDVTNLPKYVEITGNISDALGPMPGANIYEKGKSNNVTADIDGIYLIKIPVENFNNRVFLVFQFIGMIDQEIEIFKDSRDLNVHLKTDPKLDSELFSGYVGMVTIKKPNLFKRFTNSFKKKSASH